MMKVYLCGGFKNNWQNKVMEGAPNHDYFNPRDFMKISDPETYSKINKCGIESCSVVFAYLEKDNPSPMNIPLESGFMLGQGGTVILCNEWEEGDIKRPWFQQRFIDMFLQWATFVTPFLDKAIEKLREM